MGNKRHPNGENSFLVDIPSGWDPRAKQQPARLIAYSANCVVALRVAFADFSAAPRQGFEKSERCPNSSSLFLPQAAVVAVAVQVPPALIYKKRHPDGCLFSYGPGRT